MIAQRQIVSGELHYARIPRDEWAHRLAMARAMGLHAISTYVFWNVHEEVRGAYRFDGRRDVRAFIHLAEQHDLAVLLRPGPYVCAEWDLGGLPAWLLARTQRLRTTDEVFMAETRRWFERLAAELADMFANRGGPIVAVQLENEYGAFAEDAHYLRALADILKDVGFGEVPLYTIDQPRDLARGSIDGVAAAVTFAPGGAQSGLEALRAVRQSQRAACGEYWTGWFDHWGEPRASIDAQAEDRDLRAMLDAGASVNLYMLHGGTNFGLWNGANTSQDGRYQATVTSYDYQAAIDEAGAPTAKYQRFRKIIGAHTKRHADVPAPPVTIDIPPFELTEAFDLDAALAQPVGVGQPQFMEHLWPFTRLRALPNGSRARYRRHISM